MRRLATVLGATVALALAGAGAPAGAPASWDAWRGLWGVPRSPVFGPPLTPAFQRRYQHPFATRHSGRHIFQIL